MLSIDSINALISFLGLVIAIIAFYYAEMANNKANEIANKQRIDALMPDIIISDIKSKVSLVVPHFPFMPINSIDVNEHDPSSYYSEQQKYNSAK